jgi:hypothetical protein
MTRSSVYYVALGAHGGFEGGGGVTRPPPLGSVPSRFFLSRETCYIFPCFSCHLDFLVHCWAFFRHMVFFDGFLFLIKELGLLTNPGHWVRVLDVVGSYMYIVL